MKLLQLALGLAALSHQAFTLADLDGVKISIKESGQDCDQRSSPGDTLDVTYRGTLASTGTEFDSNLNAKYPFTFTLGNGGVIKGWEEGLQGMCVNETRTIEIPPSLAYGDQGVGRIPPGSTLIFDVRLISLKVDPSRTEEQKSSPTDIPLPPPPLPPSDRSGECKILGNFSLFVQGAMGLLATGVLVAVRHFEKPQRPLKVWFFDVSKQVVGSSMMHLANLGLSMLSSGQWDFTQASTTISVRALLTRGEFSQSPNDSAPHAPNPCSFYLLNLGIDATLGVLILVIWLRFWHRLFLLTPLADPPLSITSGKYDHPGSDQKPRASWWLKQCVIYFLSLFSMKFCVFLMFHFFPWIVWFGDWTLKWTEGNQKYQIIFVMFLFPLIMNAFQLVVTDKVIKLHEKASDMTSERLESATRAEADVTEALLRGPSEHRPGLGTSVTDPFIR